MAGRARQVILILSKLGGKASPSLRWLRLCRRPFTLIAIFRLRRLLFTRKTKLGKLLPKKMPAVATAATKRDYVRKTIQQSSPKSSQNNFPAASCPKDVPCDNISFHRLKHTSDASWTQQFPPQTGFGLLRESLSKKNHKGAQQNPCRLDFRRQRFQSVSEKAPN